MLANWNFDNFEVPQGASPAPPAWVSELISRLDEDLLDEANKERDPSQEALGEPGGKDVSAHATPPPFGPDEPPGHASGFAHGNAPEGAGPGEGPPEVDASFFDSVFGWLTDLLASIFGGSTGEEAAEAPPPPASYIPDPPPEMSNDIVFIEYIPEVPVDESGTQPEDFEEDDVF